MSHQRLPGSYYYNNGINPPTPLSGPFSEDDYADQDWNIPSAVGPPSHYHPNIDFWEGYNDDGAAPQQSLRPITSPNMVCEQVTGNRGYNYSAFPTAPPLTTSSNNNTVSTPGNNWNYGTDGQVVQYAVNPQGYSAPSSVYVGPPAQQPMTTPVSSSIGHPAPDADIDATGAPADATETAWLKGRWCKWLADDNLYHSTPVNKLHVVEVGMTATCDCSPKSVLDMAALISSKEDSTCSPFSTPTWAVRELIGSGVIVAHKATFKDKANRLSCQSCNWSIEITPDDWIEVE